MRSGELTVERHGDMYELDFPLAASKPIPITEKMKEALGVTPLAAYLNRDLMFLLDTKERVRHLQLDLEKIKGLKEGLGVVVTAPSTSYDFVSRAFFPKLNIAEDPVCGSAHCALLPFWAEKLGKETLVARQVSARGGTLYCKLENGRVKMAVKQHST